MTVATENGIIGRGARDGAELFRNWYGDLTKASARGEKLLTRS